MKIYTKDLELKAVKVVANVSQVEKVGRVEKVGQVEKIDSYAI